MRRAVTSRICVTVPGALCSSGRYWVWMESMASADFDFDVSDEETALPEAADVSTEVEDAPVVRFLQKMLVDAINLRASDLHFEPYEFHYRVRFRVDGELREVPALEGLETFSLDGVTYEAFNTSGGLGTMGYAVPAAMGAKMACPDTEVWAIDGDGCFQMTNQELATCAINDIPIKVAIINNESLGMVRQWQQIEYGSRYSESYMDSLPDFDKLAESFGHVGMTITKPGDVESSLKEAFAMKDKLVFMNFITDRDENVWPMVKAGKGLTEMLLGSEDL